MHYLCLYVAGKPKPDDGFFEKFATSIVRNIQISISNIHIRYEDRVNNPEHPFSVGITLSQLHILTTDEFWQTPTNSQSVTTMCYKVNHFLTVYANVY